MFFWYCLIRVVPLRVQRAENGCVCVPVAVTESSSDGFVICYVLLVLWMTLYFHTMIPMGGRHGVVWFAIWQCQLRGHWLVAGHCDPLQCLTSSARSRLAGAVLAVRRLDSAASMDGVARFPVCFVLVSK